MVRNYRLSRKADADIEAIAKDSIERWGLARAETYIMDMHETFRRLATYPKMGKDVGAIRPGYFRIESGRHSIFYRVEASSIIIVRVLHQRMKFDRHL